MEQGKICCSSTGNHGLSAAAYAGRSGGKSIILFPPETPKLMVDLASSYGAVSVITEWHARDPMAHCGATLPPYRYLGFQANELLKDSKRLIGFIGGAAVDQYGNVSATCARL